MKKHVTAAILGTLATGVLASTDIEFADPLMFASIPTDRVEKVTTDDLYVMTEMIYFEARSENLKGQMAVGLATLNRVEDRYHPNTLEDVIHFKAKNKWGTWTCAYSYYCDGKSDFMSNSEARDDVHYVADLLLSNDIEDFTNGATLYFNPDEVSTIPHWARSVCTVYLGKWGAHEFYDQDVRVNCEKTKPSRFSRTR
ncbi:cell wall hydrolase [Vibrio phage 2.275.O._10N.286.54.E11]|nr:cell wall hydrolase [Vibrio phage 2.275.O._10N.286.54.E11]